MRAMLSGPSIYVDLLVSDRLATHLRRVASVLAFGFAGCLASLPSHAMVELTGISQIAAGWNHTCALTTTGAVTCWGNNANGELGDNTITGRPTPVEVSGLASGVAAIAAGGYYTCALSTAGGVKCWGNNEFGQLGDNSATTRLTPVDVSGLASGVAAITTGGWHTCALTTAGGVKCWGSNAYGQLGDNSSIQGLATGVRSSNVASCHRRIAWQ